MMITMHWFWFGGLFFITFIFGFGIAAMLAASGHESRCEECRILDREGQYPSEEILLEDVPEPIEGEPV